MNSVMMGMPVMMNGLMMGPHGVMPNMMDMSSISGFGGAMPFGTGPCVGTPHLPMMGDMAMPIDARVYQGSKKDSKEEKAKQKKDKSKKDKEKDKTKVKEKAKDKTSHKEKSKTRVPLFC